MDFNLFSQQISKIENLPLPGEASHFKMMPKIRVSSYEKLNKERKQAKKAAVMALFYPNEDNNTHLLLILRKTYKGVHSNQVAFPGGKVEEEDADLKQTALRETHEEVGVQPNLVDVVKTLSSVYIPASNFEVQPFIGLYKKQFPFRLQEDEVADLVEVALVDFMNEAHVTEQILNTSYAQNMAVPAYKLNGYTVWGATAMMLSEIKELLKQLL